MEGGEHEWIGGDRAEFLHFYHSVTFCAFVDSLKALIKARQESREKELDKFYDSLAEKYAPKAKKSKPSKAGKKGKSTT